MSSFRESVFDLNPEEKLQLVEELWDDLAASPEKIPVLEWQKKELNRRKEKLCEAPDSALNWEEIKRRARGCYER